MERTLMLGWEFPPFISGGLGTACYGLTKAMDHLGMDLTFVLPRLTPLRFNQAGGPGGTFVEADTDDHGPEFTHVRFQAVASALRPYMPPEAGVEERVQSRTEKEVPTTSGEDLYGGPGPYGPDIYAEVRRYAGRIVKEMAQERFSLIHAHDWMTFPAAMALAEITGKPLVVHVHSTEFDRSGEHVNQWVYDIERTGMDAANKVITVSRYTRNIIINRYGVPPGRVEVVYNGAEFKGGQDTMHSRLNDRPPFNEKVVLFLGRMTLQKGPEYFLRAARRILEKRTDVRFVMAGDGDMLYRCIELAAELGIGHRVFFTRFLRGAEVDRAFRMADLYVMPSVSEPFGIAPLEALQHDVPVLVSRQSGFAEAFRHALKVDFWDIDQMADKMTAVLQQPALHEMLRTNGRSEARTFRWEDAAVTVRNLYRSVLDTV